MSGSSRERALKKAEEARESYDQLARPLGTFEDSIAVLEAFFAMHDSHLEAARAAARRVDLAKNDDVEDLYLVYSALDAAGDKVAAARVHDRMKGVGYVSYAIPIMEKWIAPDSTPGSGWTPRHPTRQN